MKKAYLFAYANSLGDRDTVKNVLNNLRVVEKWRYDMPNSFYLVSEYSAKQIAQEIRGLVNDKGRFIVSEISENSYGWLTDGSWHLIQNHEYKPK